MNTLITLASRHFQIIASASLNCMTCNFHDWREVCGRSLISQLIHATDPSCPSCPPLAGGGAGPGRPPGAAHPGPEVRVPGRGGARRADSGRDSGVDINVDSGVDIGCGFTLSHTVRPDMVLVLSLTQLKNPWPPS